MNTRGIHVVADLWEIPSTIIYNDRYILACLLDAVDHANMTVVGNGSHEFAPQGLTAFLILAESHISIHTFPEEGYAALDVFTCGDTCKPDSAIEFLRVNLEAGRINKATIDRGNRVIRSDSGGSCIQL